jgi:serine/threonine-protein kinase
MGTVYQAHDPRLGRDVAIKVSGERFTERFEREARAIAALNHSNICHLYDVGPDYLVMELVEGLEAAHEKGITHRDLKPANVRITPEGVVKILDFGLAKVAEAGSSQDHGVALSQSPTMPSPTMLTAAGMILGTAAYMAPEQARGKPADHRADIWAFGAVGYELLTGTQAFPGETVADILGAVLHKEPDWTRCPPAFGRCCNGASRRTGDDVCRPSATPGVCWIKPS